MVQFLKVWAMNLAILSGLMLMLCIAVVCFYYMSFASKWAQVAAVLLLTSFLISIIFPGGIEGE